MNVPTVLRLEGAAGESVAEHPGREDENRHIDVEAIGHRRTESRFETVRVSIGLEDEIAACNIALHVPPADRGCERPQFGHRKTRLPLAI